MKNLKDNDANINHFRASILSWYKSNARELPWRAKFGELPDPYHEWLSEIMLQQTVVKTVIPYFFKFIGLWPSVHDLANAPQEAVMKEWAGLGYYARARNLHKCAKIISTNFDGNFPETSEELIKLPGIGPYTAAAISSIAFSRPSVVMDGNIERVMARLFCHQKSIKDSKKEIFEYAKYLSEFREDNPGEYAQGLMDLGAMICTPNSPKCNICPVSKLCAAKAQGLQSYVPVKTNKAMKAQKYGTLYFIENDAGNLLLERRPEGGLLGGMIGIPGSDWENKQTPPHLNEIKNYIVNHTFTHFHLTLKGEIHPDTYNLGMHKEFFWHPIRDCDNIGLPSLYNKALKLYIETRQKT